MTPRPIYPNKSLSYHTDGVMGMAPRFLWVQQARHAVSMQYPAHRITSAEKKMGFNQTLVSHVLYTHWPSTREMKIGVLVIPQDAMPGGQASIDHAQSVSIPSTLHFTNADIRNSLRSFPY